MQKPLFLKNGNTRLVEYAKSERFCNWSEAHSFKKKVNTYCLGSRNTVKEHLWVHVQRLDEGIVGRSISSRSGQFAVIRLEVEQIPPKSFLDQESWWTQRLRRWRPGFGVHNPLLHRGMKLICRVTGLFCFRHWEHHHHKCTDLQLNRVSYVMQLSTSCHFLLNSS